MTTQPNNNNTTVMANAMKGDGNSKSRGGGSGTRRRHRRTGEGAWDASAPSAPGAPRLPWGKKKGGSSGDGDGNGVGGGDSVGAIADDGGGGGGGRSSIGLHRDVLLRYLRLQASMRMRQLGYVGSNFSVHLPLASPALLFYFALPSRRDPMWRLVRYAVAGGALSWMHAKCKKYHRFSPLPGMRGVNMGRPDLLPFLPPEEEGHWAGGLGINVGKTMERTDPTKIMAALSSNNEGGSAPLPWCGGRKGGSNATPIVAPRKMPLSGGTRAESATNEINNDARGGGWGGGGGEVDDNDPLSCGDGHHHPMWDPFQSFGLVLSVYRMWLESHNARAVRCARQRHVQASDQLLTLHKLTTSLSVVNNSTFPLPSSSLSKLLSSASPPFPMGGGNAADNAGYALITGALSGIGRALRYMSLH
jgi:hypothetical protein